MSQELLNKAKELHDRSKSLLMGYAELSIDMSAALANMRKARDDRGLMQIGMDSVQEARESVGEVKELLEDALEISTQVLSELGEVK